jgi:hypothetical protein
MAAASPKLLAGCCVDPKSEAAALPAKVAGLALVANSFSSGGPIKRAYQNGSCLRGHLEP